jgi:hypothetical protein
MTTVIRELEWKEFFDRISRDFLDWETSVAVTRDGAVSTLLYQGLPFNGMTFDNRHGHENMEVAIGVGSDRSQTHSIRDPRKIAFESSGTGGTLGIEDASGATTRIDFIQPMPVLVEYVKSEILTIC